MRYFVGLAAFRTPETSITFFRGASTGKLTPHGPRRDGAQPGALKRAGFHCRFHDLRVTCITKLSESQASDQTVMAIAGHVSKRMLEHYSRIRTDAKRAALDAIAQGPNQAFFEIGVHQNVHQLEEVVFDASAKSLN